ncbi:MAG: hypothetical protein NVSMB9_06850 [Isosphaeraceae bacterium]
MAEVENGPLEISSISEAAVPVAPAVAYRESLERYDVSLLRMVARAMQLPELPSGRGSMTTTIFDHLSDARTAQRVLQELSHGSLLTLTLFSITETSSWPGYALCHTLSCLGIEGRKAISPLLEQGLLVFSAANAAPVRDLELAWSPAPPSGCQFLAHPAAIAGARTFRPKGELPPAGPVHRIRESDGLEPILRMAVIWQKVTESPLRQTQQGMLYKRDRDRLEEDAVVGGPIADAIEPIPDMAAFWLALSHGVGLLKSEPGSERVSAAPPAFWSENAFHLAQMIAVRWLSLKNWHEQGGMQRDGAVRELAVPYLRPAVLLWLATLGEEEWVTTEDFNEHLSSMEPQWNKATFVETQPVDSPLTGAPRSLTARGNVKPAPPVELNVPDILDLMLLGAAYQLGLVRTAEEVGTKRRAVQLSHLGRYLLALGPPPPPRPAFEHFLFVQPNFEIIAYRQGLTPGLIGQFSRFSIWSQVSAALALRLTPESVYQGLEGGLAAQAMLDLLTRHSSRPLPPGVSEAVATWASRRERVTYHSSATLVEFATAADLEQALGFWLEGEGPPPLRVGDRLILVEDESAIPFQRFRMTGARDYRRPPEVCVEVESDGVTLSLDLARSDLLVDAELSRFSDEQPTTERQPTSANPRRRFLISAESLARAAESGSTSQQLMQWFQRRTGGQVPPAIRLVIAARASTVPPLSTSRPLVVQTSSAEILDGLAQHPATSRLVGERLGPTSIVIPDHLFRPFVEALDRMGLTLEDRSFPRTAPSLE